jgi:hypothetical protein
MKKLTRNLMALALGVAFSSGAMAETVAKDEYKAREKKIAAEYNSAKKTCDTLKDNKKDICLAEAKGKDRVARAELDAAAKPSAKARHNVLVVKAEADYAVAKERCDDLTENNKDVCLKEAKAAETSAKANADVALKTANANATANSQNSDANKAAKDTASDARKEAVEEKTDAQYEVEKAKCDAWTGSAKDACLKQAKERFGKL